jgi:lipase chaperone LimK
MRAMCLRDCLLVGAVALALGGGLSYWWGQRASPDHGAAPANPSIVGAGWGAIGSGKQASQTQAAAGISLTPDQIRTRLFKEGSFAGTEPAGDWCVASSKLKPCSALRKRFEYYILGLGEVTIDDIKLLVADEARRAHGEQIASDIMALWDKYWQLRTYAWRSQFDQSDRSSWLPVFEEQKLVRRQVLGADWAKAFFDEDEQNFKQYYAQLESGQPPPADPGEPVPQMAPGKDPAAVTAERVARYGQAAADRLAKVDEEWADWARRLAVARTEWARIQASPNLSELQRKQEMQAYIASHFQADEHVRVQALLHL